MAGENVFGLVVLSWSILAAALGPLTILQSFGKKVKSHISILMIIVGMAAVFIWRLIPGYSDSVYETLPGMVSGFSVYLISRVISKITH
ncbi:MAG: hypothetical protein H3C43_02545 [Leptonema sp. (in: Bacteria)]|nr:hypothetical protein [Leptonema sp. (in: bacteria)]